MYHLSSLNWRLLVRKRFQSWLRSKVDPRHFSTKDTSQGWFSTLKILHKCLQFVKHLLKNMFLPNPLPVFLKSQTCLPWLTSCPFIYTPRVQRSRNRVTDVRRIDNLCRGWKRLENLALILSVLRPPHQRSLIYWSCLSFCSKIWRISEALSDIRADPWASLMRMKVNSGVRVKLVAKSCRNHRETNTFDSKCEVSAEKTGRLKIIKLKGET